MVTETFEYPGHSMPLPSHILIVEDNLDMRDYIGSLLEEEYQVIYAANGQEALSILENGAVDLIISDIGMPIMDGFELLRVLRQEKENFTPFLFLTAQAIKTTIQQAFLMGVDGYITKPFESDEFLTRTNGILNNNRRRREAFEQKAQPSLEAGQIPSLEESVSFRSKWLKELENIVNAEISNPNIRVPDLAYQMTVSERTFRNRIREYTGFSPHEYMMEARMNRALQLLVTGTYLTIAEVAHAVGLEYSSYFSKNFKERFGKSPSEYL